MAWIQPFTAETPLPATAGLDFGRSPSTMVPALAPCECCCARDVDVSCDWSFRGVHGSAALQVCGYRTMQHRPTKLEGDVTDRGC